jgi:hypothetical protein
MSHVSVVMSFQTLISPARAASLDAKIGFRFGEASYLTHVPDGRPGWMDFSDPLGAIGAPFRRAAAEGPRRDGRELSDPDRKSLRVLGLGTDTDRRTLRRRYAELLRRCQPDHNGGDRGHEKALQAVIEAYTHLKSRPAFA